MTSLILKPNSIVNLVNYKILHSVSLKISLLADSISHISVRSLCPLPPLIFEGPVITGPFLLMTNSIFYIKSSLHHVHIVTL